VRFGDELVEKSEFEGIRCMMGKAAGDVRAKLPVVNVRMNYAAMKEFYQKSE